MHNNIHQKTPLKIIPTKKRSSLLGVFLFELLSCDRGRIRTPNPQSRNLIFYPVELRGLIFFTYELSFVRTMVDIVFPSA